MSNFSTPRGMASKLSLLVSLAAGLQLGACGPTVFSDASALSVIGDAPTVTAAGASATPGRVDVQDDRIVINEKIQFDYNEATIKPESDSLMREIAKVIKEHPHIKKLAIEGHTSSEGSDKYNLRLSDKRARAVMDYLVTTGDLPPTMFTAKGLGESNPVADETTDAGKEKNRRVEFSIVEQDLSHKSTPNASEAAK